MVAAAASEAAIPSALRPDCSTSACVKNCMPRYAALLGIASCTAAEPLAPNTSTLASGRTRPEQPGAPTAVMSNGSGPNDDVVLLKPSRNNAASGAGRLPMRAIIVWPVRGSASAVLLAMPALVGQPLPE